MVVDQERDCTRLAFCVFCWIGADNWLFDSHPRPVYAAGRAGYRGWRWQSAKSTDWANALTASLIATFSFCTAVYQVSATHPEGRFEHSARNRHCVGDHGSHRIGERIASIVHRLPVCRRRLRALPRPGWR